MGDLVYLRGAIASRIVQAQLERSQLYKKFNRHRDHIYMIRKELEQIDRDISYWRKVLDKMNDDI